MSIRRVKHIAVLVETDDTWGRSVVRGIANWARTEANWTLLIDPRDAHGRLRIPRGWSGDGIIARLSGKVQAEHVRRAAVPTVDVETLLDPASWLGRVATDDVRRAELALGHLLDRGFRRFAHFAPPRAGHAVLPGRRFREAVEAAGYTCAVYRPGGRARRRIDWNEEQTRVRGWLGSLPERVAIFAADAHCARRLTEACQLDGISVPDQVAILAGDTDELMCTVSTPSISSVLLASERLGYEAAGLLDRLMSGRRIPKRPVHVKPLGVIAPPIDRRVGHRGRRRRGGDPLHPGPRRRRNRRNGCPKTGPRLPPLAGDAIPRNPGPFPSRRNPPRPPDESRRPAHPHRPFHRPGRNRVRLHRRDASWHRVSETVRNAAAGLSAGGGDGGGGWSEGGLRVPSPLMSPVSGSLRRCVQPCCPNRCMTPIATSRRV